MDELTQGKAAFEVGNYNQAIALMAQVADAGNVEAMTILGNCYQLGLGVAVDLQQAERLYTLASVQGYALATNNQASLHPESANQYWKLAREQGFEHSPT